MTESTTHITQVGTVIVPVRNQEQALGFYLGSLGFEKRMDASYGEGERWVEVAPPGAATTIALVPSPRSDHAGMEVSLTTTDAEADHAVLLERGVEADSELVRMGDLVPPMFTFRDRTATGSGSSSETDAAPDGRPRRSFSRRARAGGRREPSFVGGAMDGP